MRRKYQAIWLRFPQASCFSPSRWLLLPACILQTQVSSTIAPHLRAAQHLKRTLIEEKKMKSEKEQHGQELGPKNYAKYFEPKSERPTFGERDRNSSGHT